MPIRKYCFLGIGGMNRLFSFACWTLTVRPVYASPKFLKFET